MALDAGVGQAGVDESRVIDVDQMQFAGFRPLDDETREIADVGAELGHHPIARQFVEHVHAVGADPAIFDEIGGERLGEWGKLDGTREPVGRPHPPRR